MIGTAEFALDVLPGRPAHLTDVLAAEVEQIRAGRAQPCGKRCDDGCHGPLTCLRAEHTHAPDADRGPDLAPGDVAPHAGHTPGGDFVQWTCLPGDHDGLDNETRTAARAAAEADAKAEATRALLAAVDPDLLVQLLRDGGHL